MKYGTIAALLACSMLVGCARFDVNPTDTAPDINATVSSEASLSDVVRQTSEETEQMSDRLLAPKESTTSSTASARSKSSVSNPGASASKGDSPATSKSSGAEVKFSSEAAAVGDMLTITVIGAKDKVTATSNMLGFAPKFFRQSGGKQVALLPVSYKLKPGTYQLNLTADGETQKFKITADAKEFVVQHLWVDESTTKATIASEKANQEWNEKIEPLKPVSDSKQYWDGAFLQPVQGRITTQYASQRYTNGGSAPTFHGGVDIAAATGTPVLATGAGRVQFAEFIQLTGNTVVIEHGYGLKSFYYHMDSLGVKADEIVERGQQVGKVGTTGFSTGPHLHFAMAVNNVFTNPWPLFEKAPG